MNELDRDTQERAASDLRARIEASPKLPFTSVHFAAKPPAVGWDPGAVSSIALDREGRISRWHPGNTHHFGQPVAVVQGELMLLASAIRLSVRALPRS